MREYRQPWRPITLDGRRARLQILDPATAFAWEPTLIGVLGDTLSFAMAAPGQLLGAVFRHSAAGAPTGVDLQAMVVDPVYGPAMAEESLRMLGAIVAEALTSVTLDPVVAKRCFRDFVIGRVEIDREVVESIEDWVTARLSPMAKWRALAFQIRQTFGPLWLRAPYRLHTQSKTYGVPEPKAVPVAVRWADNLARNGSASSSREILREWTPVEMIEVVENAAYQAEVERRAQATTQARER